MTARTVNERQAALRARRAALGLARLELYARPEHHARIKAYAERLQRDAAPRDARSLDSAIPARSKPL